MGYFDPGQQFIIRLQSLSSGTATLTASFGRNDLEIISGAYLSLTTATSTTSVIDTKLSNVNTYLGRVIEFTSNANATSLPNVGLRRVITSYVVSSQTIGFDALPAAPQVGDKYKILSPIPRSCSKVAVASIALSGGLTAVAFTVNVSNAAGNKWGTSIANSSTSPIWTNTSFPVPVEFSVVSGDITVAIVDGTWATTNDFYVQFTAS